jgi:2-dehydropantoate 2-reductase
MLQDVTKGRKTEIEAINGVIVENGRRLGLETPVNEKLFSRVVSLTKFKVDD